MRFEGRINLLDFGAKLVETANGYGMENLEADFFLSWKVEHRETSRCSCKKSYREYRGVLTGEPITAVHRLGVINGFFGLNPLIEGVTNKLLNPAVFIYPGKRKDHILTFLDEGTRHRFTGR